MDINTQDVTTNDEPVVQRATALPIDAQPMPVINTVPQNVIQSAEQTPASPIVPKTATSSGTVTMTQGAGYNPSTTGPAPTAINNTKPDKSTILTSTGSGSDNMFTTNSKSGLDKKYIMIIIAAVVLVGIAAVVMALSGGNTSSTDNEFVEDSAGVLSDEELFGDTFIDENIDTTPVYTYTDVEVEELREVGYTGLEIEEFGAQNIPSADLIQEATIKRDAWVQEAIAPLYDATSKEYKEFIGQTWLTLSKRNDTDEWTDIAGFYEERKNLDYEKVDTYGNQMFIKIYLDDSNHGDWFFQLVTPEEWNALGDSGNIIVTYTYCTRYVSTDDFTLIEDFNNIFITKATLEII